MQTWNCLGALGNCGLLFCPSTLQLGGIAQRQSPREGDWLQRHDSHDISYLFVSIFADFCAPFKPNPPPIRPMRHFQEHDGGERCPYGDRDSVGAKETPITRPSASLPRDTFWPSSPVAKLQAHPVASLVAVAQLTDYGDSNIIIAGHARFRRLCLTFVIAL